MIYQPITPELVMETKKDTFSYNENISEKSKLSYPKQYSMMIKSISE